MPLYQQSSSDSAIYSKLPTYQIQQRRLDFLGVRHACPKSVYIVPTPHDANLWQGVIFVRSGPYASAIPRFQLSLHNADRPPIISIITDVFHPLVTPLTTYTYSTSDTGSDTVSASDQDRLQPGGFTLRHGFQAWYGEGRMSRERFGAVQILEVLYYMRSAFESETVLDKIPLDFAVNASAWHAWHAFRSKSKTAKLERNNPGSVLDIPPRSSRQLPGGARQPGQWNWDGVWEERVRRCVQTSLSQHALYTAEDQELINFLDIHPEVTDHAIEWKQHAQDAENEPEGTLA